ncbi:MAG TPA: hypothetical protein DEV93_17545 [Chloroflexi bacterium]|nr:hypothetical protein [Chloroflexota bacterium]
MDSQEARRERLKAKLRSYDGNQTYYALTLLGSDRGPVWSAQTHYAGNEQGKQRLELRQASLVDPEAMARL